MTRFLSNFSAAPRGDPIICNRGQALPLPLSTDALSMQESRRWPALRY